MKGDISRDDVLDGAIKVWGEEIAVRDKRIATIEHENERLRAEHEAMVAFMRNFGAAMVASGTYMQQADPAKLRMMDVEGGIYFRPAKREFKAESDATKSAKAWGHT